MSRVNTLNTDLQHYMKLFKGSIDKDLCDTLVREMNTIKFQGHTFYDPKTATKELVDEVFETVNNRSKVIRIITMAKSAIRHNMRDELGAFTMPAKMIWGSDDRITPPFVGEEFNKLLPNSSLSFIDQCGHAPMMERPQEFNKIFMDFLTSL